MADGRGKKMKPLKLLPELEIDEEELKEKYEEYLKEDPIASFEKAMKSIPLLMNELPNADEDYSDNPALAALQSLIYEGTPEEIADNFKNQGNDAFKEGKLKYKDAITFYTKGLEQKCKDVNLNSVLLSNRAAVQLELENYGMARADCITAIELNPKNVKAYYRAAKACRIVGRLEEAIEFLQNGLKVEPDNMALVGEKLNLEKKLKEERLKKEQKEKEESEKRRKHEAVEKAIKSRDIKTAVVTPKKDDEEDEFTRSNIGDAQVYLDEDEELHWPLFFLYPEFKTSDFIQDFCESNTFADHMDEMFPQNGPFASWDVEKKYRVGHLNIYFETTRKDGSPALAKIGPELTLLQVLSHPNYVVKNNIPSFFITVKDSNFDKSFQAKYSKKSSS